MHVLFLALVAVLCTLVRADTPDDAEIARLSSDLGALASSFKNGPEVSSFLAVVATAVSPAQYSQITASWNPINAGLDDELDKFATVDITSINSEKWFTKIPATAVDQMQAARTGFVLAQQSIVRDDLAADSTTGGAGAMATAPPYLAAGVVMAGAAGFAALMI